MPILPPVRSLAVVALGLTLALACKARNATPGRLARYWGMARWETFDSGREAGRSPLPRPLRRVNQYCADRSSLESRGETSATAIQAITPQHDPHREKIKRWWRPVRRLGGCREGR